MDLLLWVHFTANESCEKEPLKSREKHHEADKTAEAPDDLARGRRVFPHSQIGDPAKPDNSGGGQSCRHDGKRHIDTSFTVQFGIGVREMDMVGDDLTWGFRIDTTSGKYEITSLPPVSARSLGVVVRRPKTPARSSVGRPGCGEDYSLRSPPVVEANLDVEARELGWLDNDRSNHLPRRRLCEAGDMHRDGHGLPPRSRGSNYHI